MNRLVVSGRRNPSISKALYESKSQARKEPWARLDNLLLNGLVSLI